MKSLFQIGLIAVVGVLDAGVVSAQQNRYYGKQVSATVESIDPLYFAMFDEETPESSVASPSDAVTPAPVVPMDDVPPIVSQPGKSAATNNRGCCASHVSDTCNDSCCSACSDCRKCKSWCDLGDPWTLFCNDNEHGISVGGWTQIGYHTQGRNGAGVGYFNNYPNRVQLQEQWAYIEKAVDTEGCGFDWGFRADYVYGTDGPDTQAFGSQPNQWDNPWDNGLAYGHAIPQLYFEVGVNDLKVKMGHFFTIVGYEVVPATGNFFYSHSFSMNFTEPFTHTGALAEYSYSDDLTLYGGWAAGWDTGFTRNNGDIFLGGATMQLTDWASLAYVCTYGNFGFGPGGSDNNGYSHSIVIDMTLTDRLEYVFQSDYVNNDLFVAGANANEILSVNQYLFYTVSDCLKLGARVEHYDNEGFGDENLAITVGANVRPHANMVFRPEVRWDIYDPNFAGPAGVGPLDQAVFGIDAIMTF